MYLWAFFRSYVEFCFRMICDAGSLFDCLMRKVFSLLLIVGRWTVRRHYLDYNLAPIMNGVPDSFIESLTHDSIIVQITYLKGRICNRLERILLTRWRNSIGRIKYALI